MTIAHEDLIAEARSLGDRNFTLSVPDHAKAAFRALADALESTIARLRDAEREMHARELHHFEEEKLRAEAEDRAERYQGLARRTELQCQDAEARLREAEAERERWASASDLHASRATAAEVALLEAEACIEKAQKLADSGLYASVNLALTAYKPTTENGSDHA